MHKIKSGEVTTGAVKIILKEKLKGLLQVTIHFYWWVQPKEQQFSFYVLDMIMQLGIPTYFRTLHCADLWWEELPYIINKLSNLFLSDRKLMRSSYQERCNMSNNNPVLMDRHFQYNAEVFFKEIVFDNSSRKTHFYATRIEFHISSYGDSHMDF